MANDSEKYIKNAVAQNGKRKSVITNKPKQYTDQNAQYYARQTTRFVSDRAKYASDYVKARVQGVFADDFYRFATTNIRFADISSETSTATKLVDDFKNVLFAEEKISYFPIGAKIETMGSTWLCINPSNISSVHTTAIVQRCNASYNLYDYYGNIITEPIAIQKATMASNSNANGENLVLMDGYFEVTCQLNENTRLLDQNQRIILGSKSYEITGFVDFMQEFTGDYDSVHLLHFTVRIGEPIVDDDLINHIVNGKQYYFRAEISGSNTIKVGQTVTLTATFINDGSLKYGVGKEVYGDEKILETEFNVDIESGKLSVTYPDNYPSNGTTFKLEDPNLIAITPDETVAAAFSLDSDTGTLSATVEDIPISWIWESLDESVATVDEDGNVTAISAGTTQIKAVLSQNKAISAVFELVVEETATEPYVQILGVVPQYLSQYDSVTITAAYFEDGEATDNVVEWQFDGSNEKSYSVTTAGNTITILCLSADSTPLKITAVYGDYSDSTEIVLEGY